MRNLSNRLQRVERELAHRRGGRNQHSEPDPKQVQAEWLFVMKQISAAARPALVDAVTRTQRQAPGGCPHKPPASVAEAVAAALPDLPPEFRPEVERALELLRGRARKRR
jgi:hypothetical protein